MQVTDELRVLVEAEVARAVENLKKFESGVGQAEQKTKSLGDAIDSVSKKSMLISAAIGGAAIAAVKFAGENEKLKLSLKSMLGSADEASAVFEEWRRLGNSPGLSSNEVFGLGRAMVNMGHDTAYATQTIQMLGNVAAGTGKSFGTISGSFEHVRAQGKLTTRDLTSLQQQGIPVLKQLAKELNTSEEGVRRLAAEGKIGFPELESAFKSMTGPGGQFAGMMDELSGTVLEKFSTATAEAKQALASFGEAMLPMATELLDSATSIMRGITDMDEGTKRFVIGMGGVVAISGPAIAAIKGIRAAMLAVSANPFILAIGGAIVAVGALAGVINTFKGQIDQAAKDHETAVKKMAGNNRELLQSAESFEVVSRRIRGLSRDMFEAARATGNFSAATEAAERVMRLNQQLINARERSAQSSELMRVQAQSLIDILEMPVDPNVLSWLDGYATEIEKINAALEILGMNGYGDFYRLLAEGTPGWAEAVASQSSEEMLNVLRNIDGRSPAARTEIERIQNEIHELLSGTTILPLGDIQSSTAVEAKKRWQEWYGEITKIDPALFGDSGAMAAELYLAEFSRSFEAGKTVFAALGEDFDIAGALRSQQGEIQKALVDLLSVNPEDIDDPFTLINESIKPLIEEYRLLGAAAKEAFHTKQIEDLQKKIDDFGKTQGDLAYDAAIANGALGEQAEEMRRLTGEYQRTEILAEYNRQIEEIGKSQWELARAAYAATGATEDQIAAFKATFDLKEELEQAEQLKETLKGIKDSLVNLAAGSTLSGIEELGRAFGQGANAGKAMKDALAAMHLEILNALPNLFLQAGLQLISQGQWPLGLGFVAAAGSTALIKGYVGDRIEAERDAAQANAHGNVFDAGITPYAHGGTFTNQIVNQPTLFKFARGTGLMGEAGPEAIMPLKRMANGDLGVAAGSGGTQVTVNIINNSDSEVRKEEYEDGDGNKQIDVIIGSLVNSHIASGKADRVMGGRYGVRPMGV